MNDLRMKEVFDNSAPPFDMKRMFWGRFKPFLQRE